MRQMTAIMRIETLLLAGDPSPVIVVIAVPVVLVAFLADGFVGGPGRSVPALATIFGFFAIPWIGMAFFRDHGWRTWTRLRMSAAHPAVVVLGKVLPYAALLFAQQTLLLFIGWLSFGMPWNGSVSMGAAFVATVVAVEVAIALALIGVCNTINQLNAVAYVGSLVLCGIGGALTPLSALPDWVTRIAPASPVYWVLRGYESLIKPDRSPSVTLHVIGLLLALSAVSILVTARFLRFADEKTYFA